MDIGYRRGLTGATGPLGGCVEPGRACAGGEGVSSRGSGPSTGTGGSEPPGCDSSGPVGSVPNGASWVARSCGAGPRWAEILRGEDNRNWVAGAGRAGRGSVPRQERHSCW